MKKAVARGASEDRESLDARLEEMGRKMDRLRALYESFFLGIERAPPNVPRRELNRVMVEMQQAPINNATLRFRFQSLLQRWVLYTTYWNRTIQEIDGGTYRRDLARARRHIAERGGNITEQEALALGIPASRVRAFVGRQVKLTARSAAGAADAAASAAAASAAAASAAGEEATAVAQSGSPPATPATPAAPGAPTAPAAPATSAAPARPAVPAAPAPSAAASRLSDKQLAAFFQKYSEAHHKAVGAPPRATPEQLRDKLEKLLAGQALDRIDLDVSVEGGKIRVRAKPLR